MNTTSPFDQIVSATGNNTAPNGGTITTSTGQRLFFVVGVDDWGNNAAPTVGSGYSLQDHQDDADSHERFYTEARISSSGSYITNFTIGATSKWAVIGASFK
jgi:hypothetical protein